MTIVGMEASVCGVEEGGAPQEATGVRRSKRATSRVFNKKKT